MRRHAADDRVVFGIAGRIDVTLEQRADERIEGEVDRVDRLKHDECVAGHRRPDVMGVEPLHGLGGTRDDRGRLAEFDGSPVVALNRAIVVANVHGPDAGLAAVAAIENREKLDSYYLLYAVLGEFESRLHHVHAAAAHFRKSLQLAEIKSEQVFLSKRLQACEQQAR